MPPLVGKTLICSEDKTWHHVGTPICVDVEPPVFETCPSTLVYGTERSSNKSLVTWIEPTASDNSGEPVQVYQVRGHIPDTRLPAGQYDIVYGVRDQTGNTGSECRFSVIVRDIRCPMIYPTPYTRVSCPDGTRTGAMCAIVCEPGKKLMGIDSVSCEQSTEGIFGVWNWKNDTQSVCENTLQCISLEPPKSGAIACDNWLGGEFCQAQCQNGTEMPNVDLNRLYVCDDVGHWIPKPMFKECQAIHSPIQQSTLVNAAVSFDGDCTTLESRRQIAENFIYQLQHSVFFHPEVCPDNTECNPDNVQISCGEVGRRKRSADSIPLNVNKTHVSVKIRLYLPTITDNIQDARVQYQTILSNVQRFVSNDAEIIFGNILVHDINIDGDGIKTHCDIGTVVSEDGLGCVACPAGTYINENKLNENSECQLCQKGFYQDHSRQSYCKRCPEGKTTEHRGTQDSSQCKDACPAGMFSSDGLPPCTPCHVGFYQSEPGQIDCTRCSAGMTTQTFGSRSIEACSEFDLMFDGNNASSATLSFREVILKEFTMTMWIRLTELADYNNDTFQIVLLNNDTDMQWGIEDDSILSKRKFINLGIVDDKWHYVVIFNKNCSTEVHLDGAPLFVNVIESDCEPMVVTKIKVSNGGGQSVSLTQLNIWQGIRNVSMKRSCLNSEEGTIIRWQTFDAAILNGTFTTIPSQCDDIDECFSMPCVNGVCKDILNDFICTCNSGFYGKKCNVNIDDCKKNVCQNGATCIDGVSSYTCRCSGSYTGKFCEIFMVDGQWNKWGNWSECSTSCGEGHMIRTRLCNNPLPDNGGKQCPGSDIDVIACTPPECTVCPEFVAPMNGSIECINTSDTINCTISCDAGFDFDIAPMKVYTCGPNTGNVWNYQTSENPKRRLPKCTEIAAPTTVEVNYVIRYKSIPCSSTSVAEKAQDIISKQAKRLLSRVSCVATGICKAMITNVTTCSNNEVTDGSAAGVSMTLQRTDLNETYVDDIIMLDDAVNRLQDEVENGQLNVQVGGKTYEADLPKSKTVGNVKCRSGQTPVVYYCVSCGSGSYSTNDTCVPCPVGQYQDSEGQLTCLFCPSGSTTAGEGSDSLSDCSIASIVSRIDNAWILGTGIGLGSGLWTVIVVSICCFRRYRSKLRKYNQGTQNANSKSISSKINQDAKHRAESFTTQQDAIPRAFPLLSHGFDRQEDAGLEVLTRNIKPDARPRSISSNRKPDAIPKAISSTTQHDAISLSDFFIGCEFGTPRVDRQQDVNLGAVSSIEKQALSIRAVSSTREQDTIPRAFPLLNYGFGTSHVDRQEDARTRVVSYIRQQNARPRAILSTTQEDDSIRAASSTRKQYSKPRAVSSTRRQYASSRALSSTTQQDAITRAASFTTQQDASIAAASSTRKQYPEPRAVSSTRRQYARPRAVSSTTQRDAIPRAVASTTQKDASIRAASSTRKQYAEPRAVSSTKQHAERPRAFSSKQYAPYTFWTQLDDGRPSFSES